MGVRENKVERFLDDEFKRRGGLTRKWVSPGRDGVPDRFCVVYGTIWLVEVKTTDGINEDHQIREQGRLADQGCRVRVVYGAKGVCEFLREIDHESTNHKKL